MAPCIQQGRSVWGNTMKLPRRKFLHLAAGAAALPAVSRIASAHTYPTRPVHIIVGYAPGGSTDIVARLIGQWLSERLGQQFVVDNRSGASGNIGTELVVRAPPDGYTLLMAFRRTQSTRRSSRTLASISSATLHRSLASCACLRDGGQSVVSGQDDSRVHRLRQSQSGQDQPGVGRHRHPQPSWPAMFMNMAGIDAVHVPYRGGAPAITALIAGQVQVYFNPLPEPFEQIRAGKLRALGVTTATRSDALPDVPSIGEFVPRYEAAGWRRRAEPPP